MCWVCQPHKPEIKGALDFAQSDARQSPLYGSYPVKNQRFVQIGVLDKKEEILTNLEKVIPGVLGKKGVDLYRVLSEKLARMEIDVTHIYYSFYNLFFFGCH